MEPDKTEKEFTEKQDELTRPEWIGSIAESMEKEISGLMVEIERLRKALAKWETCCV